MRLRPETWQSLLAQTDEETWSSMIFLMALQDINEGISRFSGEEIDEIDLQAPDLIPNCVATILLDSRPELALRSANSANAPRRKTRPGRNAPCSCGSGRKYKHCFGKS